MKKTIAIISSLCILIACLVTDVSAATASFNNSANPYTITLPASKGCGDNKVGLRVNSDVYNYGANQSSEYYWYLLTGTPDVLHACDAVRFDVTNKLYVVDVDLMMYQRQKQGQFYGSQMTTTSSYSITNNYVNIETVTSEAIYSYKTVAVNPFDQSVITDITFSYDLP